MQVILELTTYIAYNNYMRWAATDISFDLVDAETDAPVATIAVRTPLGLIEVMAAIDVLGRTIILRRAHIQSAAGTNATGIANLRTIADAFLQEFDYDLLEIEGEVRTTGASPRQRQSRA